MSRPDDPDRIKMQQYQAKSIEALEIAATCKDLDAREAWESIAESYHDLAARLDRKLSL